eukprot:12024587-Heterocapsa_arctica.AAC.1
MAPMARLARSEDTPTAPAASALLSEPQQTAARRSRLVLHDQFDFGRLVPRSALALRHLDRLDPLRQD